MEEIKFVIKTLVFTILVVLALQIQVDGVSIEKKSYQLFTSSAVSTQLNAVAKGAIVVSKEISVWTQNKYHELFKK